MKSILKDLSSLRVQLIIAAYIFNLLVLASITFYKVNYLLGVASIGLLTTVYGAFFVSKHFEALNSRTSTNPVNGQKDPLENVQ